MYYYSLLSDTKKRVYDQILDCLNDMCASIPLGSYNLTADSLDKMFHMVLDDHPEIFWTEETCGYTYRRSTGIVQTFSPIYRMDYEQRNQMQAEILKSEKFFLDGIRFSMTPYEKALRLYENIPRMITYDDDATVGERKERRKKKLDDCSTIYGAFVLHKAVCCGYAKAYQYLLRKFGIRSIVLGGDTEEGRHSWNIINLEDKWYHVDVTWGDQIKSFTDGYISYAWFCLTDRDASLSRKWDKSQSLPVCSDDSKNYYVKNELYFGNTDYQSLVRRIDKEISINKYRKIQLRFTTSGAMNAAWNYLLNENTIFKLYEKNRIPIKQIWHSIDSNLNILTFWVMPGE